MTALFAILSFVTALAAADRLSDRGIVLEPSAGLIRFQQVERAPEAERFDDHGARPVLGLRGWAPIGDAWDLGFGIDRSAFDATRRLESATRDTRVEMEVLWWGVEVRRWWTAGRSGLSGTLGAGAIVLDAGEFRVDPAPPGALVPADVAPPDPRREIDAALSAAIGVRRDLTDRMQITAEAGDVLHVCRGTPDRFTDASHLFCDRDALLHHLRIKAGLQVAL